MEKTVIASSPSLRTRVLSGSMIMLFSSALVGGLNLLYNLAIVHKLGAGAFGQASAVYTVLMLLSAVHWLFSFCVQSSSPGTIRYRKNWPSTVIFIDGRGFMVSVSGWLCSVADL